MLMVRLFSRPLSTSSATLASGGTFNNGPLDAQRRRRGIHRPKRFNELKQKRLSDPTYWVEKPVLATTPLSTTYHPRSKWADTEDALQKEAKQASEADMPWLQSGNCENQTDPYEEVQEPVYCVLCPKK